MPQNSTMPIPPSGVPPSYYTAKKYEKGKYSVEGYEYPSDLMGKNEEYGGNYAIFYVNVVEDSKMLKNDDPAMFFADIKTVDISDSERIKKAITGLDLNATKAILGGAVAGGLAGKLAGSVLGFQGTAGGAAVGGLAAAAIATQASSFTRSQKRLQTAIALHIPNDLSIRYGVGWGEEETFAGSAMFAGANEIGAAGDNLNKAASNIGGIVAAATLRNVPGANTLGIASGIAPNPKKEQAFSGVDFRTFTFNYRFAPRSSAEAKNVLNIINVFKYHMHPEYKDSTGFLFLYPSEFDIVYYHGASENLNIHRHTSCVLTDMTVNYTPNGVFNTFSDGMPTEISVQMNFKELTILTKELIQDGL